MSQHDSTDIFVIRNHRLCGVEAFDSPNQGERPQGCDISLLVLHNISLPPGQFGGRWIDAFFLNQLPVDAHPYFSSIADLKVSAHLLIDREGRVIQFVSFDKRAWHAGMSSWQGCDNCNDYSIGIELEGTDELPYTEAQYQTLVCVTRALQLRYPLISRDRIVGHSDVAPGRKTDPGPAFDWCHYRALLDEGASL